MTVFFICLVLFTFSMHIASHFTNVSLFFLFLTYFVVKSFRYIPPQFNNVNALLFDDRRSFRRFVHAAVFVVFCLEAYV